MSVILWDGKVFGSDTGYVTDAGNVLHVRKSCMVGSGEGGIYLIGVVGNTQVLNYLAMHYASGASIDGMDFSEACAVVIELIDGEAPKIWYYDNTVSPLQLLDEYAVAGSFRDVGQYMMINGYSTQQILRKAEQRSIAVFGPYHVYHVEQTEDGRYFVSEETLTGADLVG